MLPNDRVKVIAIHFTQSQWRPDCCHYRVRRHDLSWNLLSGSQLLHHHITWLQSVPD